MDDSEIEEHKSMIDTTITSLAATDQSTAQAAAPVTQFEMAEDDFDAQFFGRKVPKVKLNKGEKRELKFAMKAGVNINEVGDLKSFLGQRMKQVKQTHNTPLTAASGMQKKKQAAQKTNTYKGLEDYTSD